MSFKEQIDSGIIRETALISVRAAGRIDTFCPYINVSSYIRTFMSDCCLSDLREQLNPSVFDAFDRPTCFPGTHQEIRQGIIKWVLSGTAQTVFWFYGIAGLGKSTVSTTIASYFRQISRLGAFLFLVKAKSEPSLVIRSIVYQLALFDASIGERILSEIDQGHRDALVRTSVQQFAFEPALIVRVCVSGSSSGRRISLRVRCSTLCTPGMTWRQTDFCDSGTTSWPPSRRSLSLAPRL